MSVLYTCHGKTQSLQEWGAQLGIHWKTLWARINNGTPLEIALTSGEIPKKGRPRDKNKTIEKTCRNCDKHFVIPRCRERREHCCSPKCKREYRAKCSAISMAERRRICEVCGKEFFPRATQLRAGDGRFCSQKCNAAHNHREHLKKWSSIPENQVALQSAVPPRLKGPNNPHWKGGPKAAIRRRIESGKMNERLRAYRAENPHKTREWHQNRRARKVGRIQYGTIPELFKLQRGRCAICKDELGDDYHTDHITPLAKGGKHERYNIQLLCGPCNIKKSAKDPIKHMQSLGMLL